MFSRIDYAGKEVDLYWVSTLNPADIGVDQLERVKS